MSCGDFGLLGAALGFAAICVGFLVSLAEVAPPQVIRQQSAKHQHKETEKMRWQTRAETP
jgi:hypothetical protein